MFKRLPNGADFFRLALACAQSSGQPVDLLLHRHLAQHGAIAVLVASVGNKE
jgi:hypothetical protein